MQTFIELTLSLRNLADKSASEHTFQTGDMLARKGILFQIRVCKMRTIRTFSVTFRDQNAEI